MYKMLQLVIWYDIQALFCRVYNIYVVTYFLNSFNRLHLSFHLYIFSLVRKGSDLLHIDTMRFYNHTVNSI